MTTTIIAFKTELRDLLTKYKASINYSCDGEGYSISNEIMEVSFNDSNEYFTLSDSTCIEANDLT